LTDVLQAESELADANSEHQKALLSLFAAKAQLDKALGEE
jgi:outer membrane protein TolC